MLARFVLFVSHRCRGARQHHAVSLRYLYGSSRDSVIARLYLGFAPVSYVPYGLWMPKLMQAHMSGLALAIEQREYMYTERGYV